MQRSSSERGRMKKPGKEMAMKSAKDMVVWQAALKEERACAQHTAHPTFQMQRLVGHRRGVGRPSCLAGAHGVVMHDAY